MSNIGLSCTYFARELKREHNGAKIYLKSHWNFDFEILMRLQKLFGPNCDEHELL